MVNTLVHPRRTDIETCTDAFLFVGRVPLFHCSRKRKQSRPCVRRERVYERQRVWVQRHADVQKKTVSIDIIVWI